MSEFQAYSPDVQVAGRTIFSIVEAAGAFRSSALEIMQRHGIEDVDPDGWYAQQSFLDAFREIRERVGGGTLRQIGALIPSMAKMPDVEEVAEAFAMLNGAYNANHRGGPIGTYSFNATGTGSGLVECENPYPCEFDEGLLEGVLALYKAKRGRVRHQPGPCRSAGDERCVYTISWDGRSSMPNVG